jgi:ribulose-phosphate 3-epimerase
MVKVIPAILTDDPVKLEDMVRQIEGFADWVQIDIMDGEFVPSHSIKCQHMLSIPIRIGWEVHLMVKNPEEYFECFKNAGAQKVIFHCEATSSPQEVVARAWELGLQVGLAMNPETPVANILNLVDAVDSILFLSVYPGFYGSPFIPEVLEKIRELRCARPDVEIGIDGGIKDGNIAQVVKSGVDLIYVGSAITLTPKPGESQNRLQALADEAYSDSG